MDAVRIEGTARSSLTRKRKISKLSRRIETRRQVSLTRLLLFPDWSVVSVVAWLAWSAREVLSLNPGPLLLKDGWLKMQ